MRVMLAVLAAIGGLVACGSDDESDEIVVFAAASLTEAFTALGQAYEEANPGADVTFSFAASSELVAQLLEGAPADVFASADLANMAKLADGRATGDDPVVFAVNRSEIVVAPGNPFGIRTVADLADPDLVVVLCAPEVPCGSYATAVFANADVDVTPDSYEENVKAVITKIALGEADAGIAYATDVDAAGDDVSGVQIPVGLNVVAEYPMAVTAETGDPAAARAFVDFVLGDVGRRLLDEYGFTSP